MQTFDLEAYRAGADAFLEEVDREYYFHLAGHKQELEVAAIYERHAALFAREAVAALRELAESADGDEGRRRRYLLHLALDGLLGEATKAEAEESARLEASLDVEVDGRSVPYRQVQVELANESDAARRRELETKQRAFVAERLNPIHLRALERSHSLCRELGWSSYADAYADLRGLDLSRLAEQGRTFIEATDDVYGPLVDPELRRAGVGPLGEVSRADLPRFLRAPELDAGFPAERLVPSFAETLAGLGIELADQANVHLDTEPRPTKSPRAFCSAVQVPDEVHLVIAPVGGREDFAALFHEGGHTEHYANVDRKLPFEFRRLGDNAVTESFAFLLEHLTEDAGWLRARLGLTEPDPVIGQSRAVKLVWLRRYFAKLAYELELHGPEADLEGMPDRYAELIGGATRIRWPTETWIDDVDPGFYVACYLRAWALEALWRRSLGERFGERWFERAEAGEWLLEVWGQGQRLSAEELAVSYLGVELSFDALTGELTET